MDVVEGGCVATNKKEWADDVLVASRWRPRLDVVLMHSSCCCCCCCLVSVPRTTGQSRGSAPYIFLSAVVALNPDVGLDFIATAENSPWLIFSTGGINKENECISHRTGDSHTRKKSTMRKLLQLLCRYTFWTGSEVKVPAANAEWSSLIRTRPYFFTGHLHDLKVAKKCYMHFKLRFEWVVVQPSKFVALDGVSGWLWIGREVIYCGTQGSLFTVEWILW